MLSGSLFFDGGKWESALWGIGCPLPPSKRQGAGQFTNRRKDFSPLAPRGSETGVRCPRSRKFWDFNPLAPRGSETANTYKKAGILSPQQYNFHKQLSNYKAYFSFPSPFPHSATQFFGAKVPGKRCVLGVRTKSSPPQRGAGCRVRAHTNGGEIRRRSSGWTGAGRRRRRTP